MRAEYFVDLFGVEIVRIPPPDGSWGVYCHRKRRIWLHPELTPVQEDMVIRHELAHCYLEHEGWQCERREREADELAARSLIRICEWRKATRIHESLEAVADELEVHPHMVRVFHEYLGRQGKS